MSTFFCDQIFSAVEEAHRERDPECAQAFSSSGLALDRLIPPIPKKKKGEDDQPKDTLEADPTEALDTADSGA